MIAWNDKFATGSTLVDTQHRLLFDKINQLEQLCNQPAPSATACDELLGFLGSYAGTHFKFEEQCMERMHCPAHEKNKQAHQAFLEVFSKFRDRYKTEGPKPALLKELHAIAANWIQNHIMAIDVQLKACHK